MDHEKNLYVLSRRRQERWISKSWSARSLVAAGLSRRGAEGSGESTRLIKLKSWQEPRLLAESAPMHQERIADCGGRRGLSAAVWVANGSGSGSLLQLAGDDLR